MSPFERALKLTLGFEGGLSNDPDDRGKLTNFGVTQAAYDRFRRLNALSARSVTSITAPEVSALYRTEYWIPAHCPDLPERLALCVFDAAVNHGPGQAIRLLQDALGLTIDGIFGLRTRAAVEDVDEPTVIARYLDARQAFYDAIVSHDPTQSKFAHGWSNRVNALRDLA